MSDDWLLFAALKFTQQIRKCYFIDVFIEEDRPNKVKAYLMDMGPSKYITCRQFLRLNSMAPTLLYKSFSTFFEAVKHLTTLRESSFNMTRGGDEDIETRSLKF